MKTQIRIMLASCRFAQVEMHMLHRQLQHLQTQQDMQNNETYQHALKAHEQDTIHQLALVEDMIATLTDARTRTVMRCYYTMGWSDAQISKELDLTEEWVRKKRYSAIKELEKEWKDALA